MKQRFWLRVLVTVALITATVAAGGAPQTKAVTRVDMQSEQNAHAKAPGAVDICQGGQATVGGWDVGIMSVADIGSGKSAAISVSTYQSGVPAEFDMPVTEHTLVPLGDGLHRVLWIVPRSQQERGRVGISPVPSQPSSAPPGRAAVYLVADGSLRVNGPSIDNAWDIEATAWNTGQTPASIDILWYSTQHALQDTDPKKVQRTRLRLGSKLSVGGRVLTVTAIESETADHPMWVRFEMAASR